MNGQSEGESEHRSPSETARVRVISLTLLLAVLTLSLGIGLASAEQYQWIGKGGRSAYPSVWSAFVPRAAIGAFSLPYAVVAVMAFMRARATGGVLRLVIRVVSALCIAAFVLPSAYLLPYVVWVLAKVFAGGYASVIGLAEAGVLIGALWTWRPLLRDGNCLHDAWARGSRMDTQMFAATCLTLAYITVWVASVVAPGDMERTRLANADAAREKAKAAERARIPVGAPMTLVWRVKLSEREPTHDAMDPPEIGIAADGTIYAALVEAIAAVEPAGRVRWVNGSIAHGRSRPVPGNNGLLFIGSGDGVLYALNAENGTVAWQVRLAAKSRWATPVLTPAIASDGSIYAGASGPIGPTQFYRVAPDGRVVWHLEIPNALESSAVLDRGDTAFVTVGHALQAIAPDGRALWSAAARGWMAIPFLLPDRSIGLADGERLAILSRAGKQIAQQAHVSDVWAVDDTTALFGGGGQLTLATRMHQRVVTAADTLPAWRDLWHYNPVRIEDHENIAGVALMAGGSVVVSTQSRVVVMRISDGLPIAEYVPGPQPGPYNTNRMPFLSAPVLGVDGTIYVAGTDQSLYAVRDTLIR